MNSIQMPVSLFDLLAVAVITCGLLSGRSRGMSLELLDLAKWLSVLFGCSAAYRSLGETIAAMTQGLSLLSCYLIAYVGEGLLIILLFTVIKRLVGGKLVGSDIFGHSEYYLGMVSGVVRYGCVLLTLLALLNARYFNKAEIRLMAQTQQEIFGSDLFPTLRTVQTMVFDESLTGPLIKRNLGFLLIKPTPPGNRDIHLRRAAPVFSERGVGAQTAGIPGFAN